VESSRDLDEPPVNVAPIVAAPRPAPPVYEAAPQPAIIAYAPVLAPSPAAIPGASPAKPSKVFPPPVRAPGPQKMVSQKRYRGKKEKTVQKLYKKAMAHLNGGKKAEAMEVFVRLLEKYSKHDLADNALYWMGEIAYTDTNYRQALMWFQDVILRYPEGNKLPDSMLKSALCYAKLGDSVYAQKMLSEVETLFAAAPVAKVARERRLALAGQGGR
jgi:tol-pal system protein YbgF